jgi:hypothetical protein
MDEEFRKIFEKFTFKDAVGVEVKTDFFSSLY